MAERRLKLETGAREEDERDDRPAGGFLHRTRHLNGWSRHLHGYTCPRCGVNCTGKDLGTRRAARNQHDMWHRDDDAYHDEQAEEIEQLQAEMVKATGQVELLTELLGRALGPALDELMAEREPA